MNYRKLRILILSFLVFVSTCIIAYCFWIEDKTIDLLINLSTELLGGVIIIILFDLIIGKKQERSKTQEKLIKDLYSKEEELRIIAFKTLINAKLLNGLRLNNIDFSTFFLNNKIIHGVVFIECSFCGSQFDHSELIDCNFINCDLTGSNLNSATLTNIYFTKSNLTGVILDNIQMSNCSFDRCNINMISLNVSNILLTKFDNCYGVLSKAEKINLDDYSKQYLNPFLQ